MHDKVAYLTAVFSSSLVVCSAIISVTLHPRSTANGLILASTSQAVLSVDD